MSKNTFFLVIPVLLLSSPAAVAKAKVTTHQAQVQSCHDGDTCTFVSDKGKTIKVRFSGMDAPEISPKQPFAEESRDFTYSLLKGKQAELKCLGRSYHRETCEVFVDGRNVQEQVVEAGLAYDYEKYSKGAFKAAQARAREAKKGLWSRSDLTSPHCTRHKNDERCKASPNFQP